jgi:hypothetical protein
MKTSNAHNTQNVRNYCDAQHYKQQAIYLFYSVRTVSITEAGQRQGQVRHHMNYNLPIQILKQANQLAITIIPLQKIRKQKSIECISPHAKFTRS